jgi:undecaprenyl diphosphate synthase
MNQSTSSFHVALVMDGNGRWAAARGRPRLVGHRRGAEAVRRVVAAAPGLGIDTLTLYAFSSDNWKRPASEVSGLMRLLRRYLLGEGPRARDVRLSVIGRRDRLPAEVRTAVAAAEVTTAANRGLHLRLAIDYSARDAIVAAARRLAPGDCTRAAFARRLGDVYGAPAPDVDLLIRTGGEQRLSDFLLWECAYAELVFTPTLWPDFGPADLAAAVLTFGGRERKFGALPGCAPDDARLSTSASRRRSPGSAALR